MRYIVIHYTANDGDTATGNGNYFKNNSVGASAHYFVDDNIIIQSVPDNYVAWSVGGNRYSDYRTVGGANYYGKCTNNNSISIELCDTKKDGKIYPTEKTIGNALELTRQLMKKYSIPKVNVIRHFDVTGKRCPAYWVDNKKWKTEFWDKIDTNTNNDENKIVNTSIKISINGKVDTYLSKNVNGNNYVEARKFLTALKYTVGFNKIKKRVMAENLTLDIPTIIENGISFIHLRECISFLNRYDTFKYTQDKTITYNNNTKVIVIS